MRTANAMQLKARIKNSAKEAGIPAQAMMQNYLLERLLERLSKSEWRDKVNSRRWSRAA
ncbi:MAG: hypothetical protein Q4B45_00035 [Coriobacteriia bacterium]|nr:hypothetical protein [Coriobacteriia bacterium]